MRLPTEFKSVLEEEYGDFGWNVANCFSFIANFLGYKVLDISAVEAALKIVANDLSNSLTEYSSIDDLDYDLNILEYLEECYPKVHRVFTRTSKHICISNECAEEEREEQVITDFMNYILFQNTSFLLPGIDEFFRSYVYGILDAHLLESFEKCKEAIKKQATDG